MLNKKPRLSKRGTLYLSFLSFILTISAQINYKNYRDYLILENGTELSGMVLYNEKEETIYYKPNTKLDQPYRLFTIEEVRELSINNKAFVKKKWKGKEVIVQEVVKGDINLYEYQHFDDKTYFLTSKDESYSLEEDSYKSSLEELYGTRCNWAFNSHYLRFSKVFFKHLTKGYQRDDCLKVNRNSIGIKLIPSYLQSEVFVDIEQLNVNLESRFRLGVGIQATFFMYDRLSLYSGLEFFSQNVSEDLDVLNTQGITLDVNHLLLRGGLKLHVGEFMIGAGPILGNTFSDQSFILLSKEEEGIVESPIDLDGFNIGYDYHLGYKILDEIKKSIEVELKKSYFRGNDLHTDAWSLGITVGI